jgi:hypothetical protein
MTSHRSHGLHRPTRTAEIRDVNRSRRSRVDERAAAVAHARRHALCEPVDVQRRHVTTQRCVVVPVCVSNEQNHQDNAQRAPLLLLSVDVEHQHAPLATDDECARLITPRCAHARRCCRRLCRRMLLLLLLLLLLLMLQCASSLIVVSCGEERARVARRAVMLDATRVGERRLGRRSLRYARTAVIA